MEPTDIRVVEGTDLRMMATALTAAVAEGRKVRLYVTHGPGAGVKYAVGGDVWSWAIGRPADVCGQ